MRIHIYISEHRPGVGLNSKNLQKKIENFQWPKLFKPSRKISEKCRKFVFKTWPKSESITKFSSYRNSNILVRMVHKGGVVWCEGKAFLSYFVFWRVVILSISSLGAFLALWGLHFALKSWGVGEGVRWGVPF